MKTRILMFVLIATMTASCLAAGGPMTVKAVNKLSFSRPSQTIELSAKDLAPLGEKDLMRIHVKDAAGKDLLCQAVDTDGDYTPDLVIFQADFAAGESKTFTVSVGDKWVYTKDQFRAYGRFVRERFDDFGWENDRIAHRMYGKALETWVREPLTSSTVDIWSKRTPRMVINDWYMVDNYHVDTGEGGDFYSAGADPGRRRQRPLGRGSALGLQELRQLQGPGQWTDPGDVRADLRAVRRQWGDGLRGQADLAGRGPEPRPLPQCVQTGQARGIDHRHRAQEGLGRAQGTQCASAAGWSRGKRWRRTWECRAWPSSWTPSCSSKQTEDKRNTLILARVPEDNIASYWAGFCWDKAGQCADEQAWKTYVDQFAQGLLSPIEVSVSVQ